MNGTKAAFARGGFLAAAVIFAPLAAVLVLGAGSASLWLDEITYFRFQSDLTLRAAEIGRAGSRFAPYFSGYFYPDIQRWFQAVLASVGILRLDTNPEWTLRALSLVAYVAAASLIAFRAATPGRSAPAAAGLMFAAAPLFLYYAFEARVYSLAAFLAVLICDRIDAAARKPGRRAGGLLALLGVLLAWLHLWALCFFGALLVLAAGEFVRRRRATPFLYALVAAAAPALAVIAFEYAFLKVTQPPVPTFALFLPQPLGPTVVQTGLSIFEGPPQVQHLFAASPTRGFVFVCLALLALLAAWALARREQEAEGFSARSAVAAALLALGFSIILATTFGHFAHGRYQLPLVAVLFWGLARSLRGRRVLPALLLVAGELVLLPSAAAAIRAKSNNRQIAAVILGGSDRTKTAVIVQHGVVSGYPAPHHTIGLDFYLNDLHRLEPRIPIRELPDLRMTNEDHGTFRYFNGGRSLLDRTMTGMPALWRTWGANERASDLWFVRTVWNVPTSREQADEFAAVLGGEGWVMVEQVRAPDYPAAVVSHFRRPPGH